MDKSEKRFYYKQNRLKQLRAFCYAAQSGSISRAAERMFLSQPSVSLQVRALETEMGITLFERRGPRISLTPEGRLLYELAFPHVQGIDRLADSFADRCGTLETGELDIAAGQSTILYILPEYVQRFRTNFPGVHIRLHSVTGRDGLARLRADAVDFAIGAMPEEIPEDVWFQPSFSYPHVLIAPIGHPLADHERIRLRDISPHPLILPPRELSTWGVVDLVFRQHSVPYRIALEVGGWEVIKRYVAAGIGISIVSGVCLTGEEHLAVHPLGKDFPERTYGVVWRRGKFLSPAARRFIEMLDPVVPSEATAAPGLGSPEAVG